MRNKSEIIIEHESTADLKFGELCEEIDYWKERYSQCQKDATYWKEQYTSLLNESMATAQKGVANALMLALSVKEDGNGGLRIDKESRARLAEDLKF